MMLVSSSMEVIKIPTDGGDVIPTFICMYELILEL